MQKQPASHNRDKQADWGTIGLIVVFKGWHVVISNYFRCQSRACRRREMALNKTNLRRVLFGDKFHGSKPDPQGQTHLQENSVAGSVSGYDDVAVYTVLLAL